MNSSKQILVFTIEEQRYALRVSSVERIVRAVEITPLPKAPEIILGLVNVRGRVIPVVNTRRRFGRPEREIELSDRFILANTSERTVSLVVDEVDDVIVSSEKEVIQADSITPGLENIEGVIKLEGNIILIYNLEKFLSLEDEAMLTHAMETANGDSR